VAVTGAVDHVGGQALSSFDCLQTNAFWPELVVAPAVIGVCGCGVGDVQLKSDQFVHSTHSSSITQLTSVKVINSVQFKLTQFHSNQTIRSNNLISSQFNPIPFKRLQHLNAFIKFGSIQFNAVQSSSNHSFKPAQFSSVQFSLNHVLTLFG
jgi:hypothetical protein